MIVVENKAAPRAIPGVVCRRLNDCRRELLLLVLSYDVKGIFSATFVGLNDTTLVHS